MRKRAFDRLVKQLGKTGCWDPVGCARDIVRIAEREKKKAKKGGKTHGRDLSIYMG